MGLLKPCKTCKTSEICFACLSHIILNYRVPSCPLCRTKYILDSRFGLHTPAVTPERSPTPPSFSPVQPGPLTSDGVIAVGGDIVQVAPTRLSLSPTFIREVAELSHLLEMDEDDELLPRNLSVEFDRQLVIRIANFPDLKD